MTRSTQRIPGALVQGPLAGSRWTDLRRALAVARVFNRLLGPTARLRRWRSGEPANLGASLRLAFERLGLTYLKLGQFLAMRFDLLPADVCRELDKLFDSVPPVPFEDARGMIESELGGPLDELFAEFAPEPLAAASVAQVHEARTRDGARVAVKVQRPGIGAVFAADMRNLWRLATVLDRLGVMGQMSVREIADQFIRWTLRELDFVLEGRTAERLRDVALPYERYPRIDWSRTGTRVLTAEFMDGASLIEVVELLSRGDDQLLEQRLPGLDLSLSLQRLTTACLRQLFVTGFFHGDPHPANIILRGDNAVAFVDFGIVGELSRYHRELLRELVESVAVRDFDRAFRSYWALCDPSEKTDVAAFGRDVKAACARWQDASADLTRPVADRHVGRLSVEVTALGRRHHVRVGFDTLLFWRALGALDATALKAEPYIDLLAELRTFFTELHGRAFREVGVLARDLDWQLQVARLARTAPVRLRPVGSGDRTLAWTLDDAETPLSASRLNRTAKSIAVAALTIAATVLVGAHLGGGS